MVSTFIINIPTSYVSDKERSKYIESKICELINNYMKEHSTNPKLSSIIPYKYSENKFSGSSILSSVMVVLTVF